MGSARMRLTTLLGKLGRDEGSARADLATMGNGKASSLPTVVITSAIALQEGCSTAFLVPSCAPPPTVELSLTY